MTPSAPSTRFILIRHAQTLWNAQRRIQGQADSPLTPEGRKAAAGWGPILLRQGVDRIVSSSLGRAWETAGLVNQSLRVPMTREDRFMEQAWGQWEGRKLADIENENPGLIPSMEALGWEFTPPGGESRRQVLARCLEGLKDAHRQWPGQTLLVVGHEGLVKCLVYHLLGREFLPSEPKCLKPWRAHVVVMNANGLVLEGLNAIDLQAGGTPF